MSVGFGFSFGDFVQGISILIDLYKALDDVHGAPKEIRMLRTELDILNAALNAIDQCNLERTDQYHDTATKAVEDCLKAVKKFREKVAKYLELDEIHQGVRKAWRKVKWALVRKEDVDELRTQLGAQISALHLLLSAIHLSRTTVAGTNSTTQLSEQSRILTEIHKHLGQSDTESTRLLQKIESLVASLVPAPPYPGPRPSFEVRPLRLKEAPVIPMNQFVERVVVMKAIESDFSSFPDNVQKIVVLQGDFLVQILILQGRMVLTSSKVWEGLASRNLLEAMPKNISMITQQYFG